MDFFHQQRINHLLSIVNSDPATNDGRCNPYNPTCLEKMPSASRDDPSLVRECQADHPNTNH